MQRLLIGVVGLWALSGVAGQIEKEAYLTWPASRADGIARGMYGTGRVGGWFDTRLLTTERSYNYKLAATWMTPDAIRGTARSIQLSDRLSDDETRALVVEAEAAGDTVVMVEIDPREGSGVIPLNWQAFLQPKRDGERETQVAHGVSTPRLRRVRALAGVMRRNYDYDRLWVVFSLTSGSGVALFPDDVSEAQLVVRSTTKRVESTGPFPRQYGSG